MTTRHPLSLTFAKEQGAAISSYRYPNFDGDVAAADAEHSLGSNSGYGYDSRQFDAAEIIHHLVAFIREHVVCLSSGQYRCPSSIANRLVVMLAMIDPEFSPSLSSSARRLKVAPQCLTKIAREFSAKTSLRITPSVGVYSTTEHARARNDARKRADKERNNARARHLVSVRAMRVG